MSSNTHLGGIWLDHDLEDLLAVPLLRQRPGRWCIVSASVLRLHWVQASGTHLSSILSAAYFPASPAASPISSGLLLSSACLYASLYWIWACSSSASIAACLKMDITMSSLNLTAIKSAVISSTSKYAEALWTSFQFKRRDRLTRHLPCTSLICRRGIHMPLESRNDGRVYMLNELIYLFLLALHVTVCKWASRRV